MHRMTMWHGCESVVMFWKPLSSEGIVLIERTRSLSGTVLCIFCPKCIKLTQNWEGVFVRRMHAFSPKLMHGFR